MAIRLWWSWTSNKTIEQDAPQNWGYFLEFLAPIWDTITIATLGTMAAVLFAISLRSIGFVSKLLYESIEEIDKDQVEAVTATWASKFSTLIYSLILQVFSTFVGTTVYRWDINIRESTVVGLVGAGGIGLQLNEAILGLNGLILLLFLWWYFH